jgi:hypothetical protein
MGHLFFRPIFLTLSWSRTEQLFRSVRKEFGWTKADEEAQGEAFPFRVKFGKAK